MAIEQAACRYAQTDFDWLNGSIGCLKVEFCPGSFSGGLKLIMFPLYGMYDVNSERE